MRGVWLFLGLLLALATTGRGQATAALRAPEDFGYRQLAVPYGRDSVHVLLLSQPGEERLKKLLLLWVQGFLPTPLVLYDRQGAFPVFPFHPKAVLKTCHLAIIGKPDIPLVADVEGRNPNRMFREYAGREHNFFGFKNGHINYDDPCWDAVGDDFLRWAGLLPPAK